MACAGRTQLLGLALGLVDQFGTRAVLLDRFDGVYGAGPLLVALGADHGLAIGGDEADEELFVLGRLDLKAVARAGLAPSQIDGRGVGGVLLERFNRGLGAGLLLVVFRPDDGFRIVDKGEV